ncbi:MAG: bifunctional riboflavin kinase/FAD synthetase [Candidatus Omnitrophota bacterium]
MKTIYGINNFKKQQPTVVSVGIFDSVHVGHQKIIKDLIKQASNLRAKPAIVTFNPHPGNVLKGADTVAMLTSLKHRLSLLEALGVEITLVVDFTRSVARLKAEEFIRRFLLNKLSMKMLIIGESFSFGKDMVHTEAALNRIAEKLGFKTRLIKSAKHNSRSISSSLIRHLIERGRLKTASKLLGRPVSILGTVVRGRQRGRVIGFKTANIDPHHETIPPSGVYAVYSKLGNKIYKSVLNIGTRPTFNEKEPTIEAHIFGINRSLYGKDIEICFKKRLRSERRFKDQAHLSRQILKDACLAKKIL